MSREQDLYFTMTPDQVLNCIEECGLRPTGRTLQLNSYENRVYEVELEDGQKIIPKFYRKGRWTLDAILEEHAFLQEIQAAGLKTAVPLELSGKNTVKEFEGIYWSIFPKVQGRLPQELLEADLEKIGRNLALLHNIGAQREAPNRPTLDVETFGYQSLRELKPWILPELWTRYRTAANTLFEVLEEQLQHCLFIRIHGDCHRGNLLDSGKEFFFIDFDDFCNGPVAQDFWMLTTGSEEESKFNLTALLRGYEELRDFDDEELALFEPLRALRIIYYSNWIARRWKDPSFPTLFPQFGSFNYWSEEIEALERIVWSL